MKTVTKTGWSLMAATGILIMASCQKIKVPMPPGMHTITIENVLQSQPLVESGTFHGTNKVILPGESSSFTFSAAKGQAVTFATMYGWSNDLFFAPANPGIELYDAQGNPVQGDVSSQIKLWDNGTRVESQPGVSLNHPGVSENPPQKINEIKNGFDLFGNAYLPASSLMHASLKYNGNSMFTLTITNVSGGTLNETPFSPGVWAISYAVGGKLLNPNPIFQEGQLSANGLTNLAEMGDTTNIRDYLKSITGIFTPLSPVLLVVYNGISNPIFKTGENDEGHGLANIAQMGDASHLAAYLKTVHGVKSVYILPAANTTVLLPQINGQPGGSVSQQISLQEGDKIAIATMYGFSNDWFFAGEGGIDASKGGTNFHLGLYDDGTAVDEFPGAGSRQAAFGGTPLTENMQITGVPNPNAFTTLPAIDQIVKVTVQ